MAHQITADATLRILSGGVKAFGPGIAQLLEGIEKYGSLRRSTSGIRGRTLIVNLPGSPKAVRESMDAFIDVIGHGLRLLLNTDGECART